MLGLIYKDFAVLKRSLWFFGLWFLAFVLFCGYLSSVDFFCGALSVFCAVLPLTTLSYDSQCGWEGYALTLPVSRRALALSRYLLALIFTVASVIVNFILRFFLAQDGSIGATLTVVAAIGGAALVMIAFMLPLMYKFGVEKGRLFLILIVLLAVSLSFLIGDVFQRSNHSFLLQNLQWIAPLGGVVCFIISMMISLRIYARKEF